MKTEFKNFKRANFSARLYEIMAQIINPIIKPSQNCFAPKMRKFVHEIRVRLTENFVRKFFADKKFLQTMFANL